MTSPDGPPLSLRPFPVADRAPKNLAEFIARVNAQPGGFRDVTEAKLQDEIKSGEVVSGGDSDQDEVDVSDPGRDEDPVKDAAVVRMEVLRNIEIAGNTAMLTLDSLSLLLSKQSPTQAGLTLSQQLREMVGIGTLGADKLDEPILNPDKERDEEEVATGWTLMQINQARDAADEAGRFLQREVEAESKYWEDVMAVKKAGWSICRVPHERHTLGVKFGFSEASPEFKSNGLAPMRRGDSGSVELDLGRLGGVSEGLVVTYEQDGKVVGRSVPRRRRHDDTSLESRILEARNTIFSQELWHELTREARTLAAYDVRPEGSTLTCSVDSRSKIILELLPLESCPASDGSLPNNSVAETIFISLHVLLSYAHRYNELMRIRPIPPHISRSRGQQVYALLRPVIARMASNRAILSCTTYLGSVSKALQKAGLPASLTLRTAQLSAADHSAQGPNQPAGAQSLIRNMLQPVEFNVALAILPDTSLTVRGRTFLFPVTTTFYHVALAPSSPLRDTCAPYAEGYSDTNALFSYIRTATERAVTLHFFQSLCAAPDPVPWIHSGTSIRDPEDDARVLQFSIDEHPVALVLTSSFAGSPNRGPESWTYSYSDSAHLDSEPQNLDDLVARETSRSRP
ncbi:RNA polymerase II mediator complex component SRB4 [Metarhizium album ARSEF 1941]|uniref:Mediator of RNA polymerase II transcription subunit 17 n=1 Tax=Metarhizium album (strain ARSEF 1941) TaxID=1081103 RepID=A0A0B2X470_METAS|nr:RNA polymerase II mediator complex component SRB4 [Metarhizium album ARSEF 1941]KHO00215.1 RNA polymerase II mediator complex component SRB4 [Metarhizium album ARSEF 1941]